MHSLTTLDRQLETEEKARPKIDIVLEERSGRGVWISAFGPCQKLVEAIDELVARIDAGSDNLLADKKRINTQQPSALHPETITTRTGPG